MAPPSELHPVYIVTTRQRNCPHCGRPISADSPLLVNGNELPVTPTDPQEGEFVLHRIDPRATVLCPDCRASLTHLMAAIPHEPMEE